MDKVKPNSNKSQINDKYIYLDKEKSFFLQRYLGRGFYKDFLKRYRKEFGKDKKASYGHVMNILHGRYKGHNIIRVLNEMAMENKEIEDSIMELKDVT